MYKNGRRLFSWEDPPPLEVFGQPELSFFPERITLRSGFRSPGGGYLKEAVYVPDISSLRPDDEWGGHAMLYLSVSDPNGEIWLKVSWATDWMAATKCFRSQPVTSISGDERWDKFFERVSQLPILPEERCVIISRTIKEVGPEKKN